LLKMMEKNKIVNNSDDKEVKMLQTI
jgi:hypothetical protein